MDEWCAFESTCTYRHLHTAFRSSPLVGGGYTVTAKQHTWPSAERGDCLPVCLLDLSWGNIVTFCSNLTNRYELYSEEWMCTYNDDLAKWAEHLDEMHPRSRQTGEWMNRVLLAKDCLAMTDWQLASSEERWGAWYNVVRRAYQRRRKICTRRECEACKKICCYFHLLV